MPVSEALAFDMYATLVDPIRIWSYGGGGKTEQSNEAESSSTAPNLARTLQGGMQLMF